MSRYNQRAFKPSGRYVVRKRLKIGESVLNPGDIFPWRKLGISARRLKQLYDGRFIELAEVK